MIICTCPVLYIFTSYKNGEQRKRFLYLAQFLFICIGKQQIAECQIMVNLFILYIRIENIVVVIKLAYGFCLYELSERFIVVNGL